VTSVREKMFELFCVLLVQYLLNRYGTLHLVFIRTIDVQDLFFQVDLFNLGLELLSFLGDKLYDLCIMFTCKGHLYLLSWGLSRIFHELRSPQPQGVARDAVVCYREWATTQRIR